MQFGKVISVSCMTNSISAGRQQALPVLIFALFAGTWFWHHPYQGIVHDATLYAVQALRYLHPESFAGDVFFLYGSQDDYTLFSPFFAGLIQLAGLGQAALLITLLGALLWCYAAWRFASRWPGASRWVYLFLLAVMPIKYGGHEIFKAAEPYAVPRLWADALVLLACALWLERNRAWAVALWVAAALMHPLMALAGLLFVVFLELRASVRWGLGIAAAVLGISMLALLGVSLFGRLFQVMDPVWFDLVYKRTSYYMFPTAWSLRDYNILIFHTVAILWAAWLTEDVRFRRILLAGCLTGLAGLMVAVVGGDWLHSVLVLQVQPWRTLWLMYVVGWGAVAWLVLELWRPARFAVLGLAAAWFLRESSGSAILLLAVLLYWQRANLRPGIVRLVEVLMAGAIVFYLVWSLWDLDTVYAAVYPDDELSAFETLLLWKEAFGKEDALLSLAGGLSASFLWRSKWRPARSVVLPIFVAVLAFFAVIDGWDRRSPGLVDLESGNVWGETPFNKYIPQGASVYWFDGAQPTWFLLGRPSYYSQQQTAGLVFSRQLAMEVYRRHLRVKPLGGHGAEFELLSGRQAFLRKLQKSRYVEPATLKGLKFACGDPGLDYVVLPKRYAHWRIASWLPPNFSEGAYLYACKDFRKTNDLND